MNAFVSEVRKYSIITLSCCIWDCSNTVKPPNAVQQSSRTSSCLSICSFSFSTIWLWWLISSSLGETETHGVAAVHLQRDVLPKLVKSTLSTRLLLVSLSALEILSYDAKKWYLVSFHTQEQSLNLSFLLFCVIFTVYFNVIIGVDFLFVGFCCCVSFNEMI